MIKSCMIAFAIMMVLVTAIFGAPIVPTNSYNEVCADGTHPTACTYSGSSKAGFETSMTSFTDNLATGETLGETVSTKVLNIQRFAGSYMYASDWGFNDYTSNTFTLNLTTRSSFYNNPNTGVYYTGGSTEVNKSRSVFTSDSMWNCFNPTFCHSAGVWNRFDHYSYAGSGQWSNYLNGVMISGGEWENSSRSFYTDKGGWDYNWPSVPEGPAPVPEPGTYGMMGMGLAALGLIGRRKKS